MVRKRQQLVKVYLFILLVLVFAVLILVISFSTDNPPTADSNKMLYYPTLRVEPESTPDVRDVSALSLTASSPPIRPDTPVVRQPTATPVAITATANVDGNTYAIITTGESLESVAQLYQVLPETLRTNNWMHGNALLPGQRLLVHPGPDWQPEYAWYSRLKGDLVDEMIPAYPLSLKRDRFILHYIPHTYPAVDPQSVASLFEDGLASAEQLFGRPLTLQFDIFVAGRFFEVPNQYLRGHNFGKERYLVFLHDGSGDANDQQYLAAHEITHFYMWNTFGQPFSYLLSEGAAVYVGKQVNVGSADIPLPVFCKAYETAGVLPQVSDDKLPYHGQNYDLANYYAAGCFVQYLIENYGAEKLGAVYSNGQYMDIYGKTLLDLESEWRRKLHEDDIPLSFSPGQLIDSVEQIKTAYQHFFSYYFSSPDYLPAYIALDQARLKMLDGHFNEAADYLAQYHALVGD